MWRAFLDGLEAWEFGQDMAETALWFPILESIHILALATVAGFILFVDLRLMGLAGRNETMRTALRVLPLVWIGFAVSLVTGALMFAPAATRYAANPAFQFKMVAMALAGLNMLAFHLGPWRRIDAWDHGLPPASARLSGALSLALWAATVIFGRWVPYVS